MLALLAFTSLFAQPTFDAPAVDDPGIVEQLALDEASADAAREAHARLWFHHRARSIALSVDWALTERAPLGVQLTLTVGLSVRPELWFEREPPGLERRREGELACIGPGAPEAPSPWARARERAWARACRGEGP